MKIMHRDLKSANVFLYKDGTAKLGDLNVSKIMKSGLGYTQTGTPYYASPEVWKDKPYDIKSDIWSLGWVLYEAATLKPPFRAEDMQSLYKVVLKGVYPRISNKYSEDLHNVIEALIQLKPKNRPTWKEILEFEPIALRDKGKYIQTEEEEDQNDQNILLQTIYVPKNLMFLTDNLPKSQYETSKAASQKHESIKKPFKIKGVEKARLSPSKRMKALAKDLVLPDILKKDSALSKLSDYSNHETEGKTIEIIPKTTKAEIINRERIAGHHSKNRKKMGKLVDIERSQGPSSLSKNIYDLRGVSRSRIK